MNTDKNEWDLIDQNFDKIAILPSAKSNFKFILNEPGSGSIDIPMSSNAAGLLSNGMFARANYRGAPRGGFFIDNIKSNFVVKGNEDSGLWMQLSGAGEMMLLEDAIVYGDGTEASKRSFTGTRAGMLATLIDEAKARPSCLTDLTYDFTSVLDSDGVAWTDSEPLELEVGISLLEVVRRLSKQGIDFKVSFDGTGFILNAYKNPIGSDLSNTIFFRTGSNCEVVSFDEKGGTIKNALLIAHKQGSLTTKDNTSITANRRREEFVNAKDAQSASSAATYGAALLSSKKNPKVSVTVEVYDGVSPKLFIDYGLGDTVSLDVEGVIFTYRILAIQCDWDGVDYSNVILEMNSLSLEHELQMSRDLDWLMSQWATARDANELEVRSWVALGKSDDTCAIYAMLADGETLYVATIPGQTIGGVLLSSGLVTYNFSTKKWTKIHDLSTATIYAICQIGGDIYYGGNTSILYKWDGSTSTIVASATAFSSIYALATDGTDLYVGGNFDDIGDLPSCEGLAKYDVSGDTWSDMSWVTPSFMYGLLWHSGELYATGTEGLHKYNGSWSSLGLTGTGYALASLDTNVIVGGDFTDNLKIWDGVTLSTLASGVDGIVRAITTYLSDVYVAGEMTGGVAKLSGDIWFKLEEGINNTGRALAMHNDTLVAGGSFTMAGTTKAIGIAAYFTNFEELINHLDNNGGFDLAAAIHSATAKTSMNANDEFGMWDSITGLLRKITWSNILLSIKTYADSLYVALTGNQTVAGIKTFSDFPVTPSSAPTTDYEVANKKYVDDNIGGGGGTPGGSDTQVQFNDGGVFGGDAGLTFNKANSSLRLGGDPPGTSQGSFTQVADGVSVGHVLFTWGTGMLNYVRGFIARGTKASPTASQANDIELSIRGAAHDGVTYPASNVDIRLIANENQSTTDHGSRIEIYTTPDGGTTLTLALTIHHDGNVEIPSGRQYKIDGAQHTHGSEEIVVATLKNPPADADSWLINDVAGGNIPKRLSSTVSRAYNRALFDTLYADLLTNQTIAGVKTFSSDPLIPDEAYDATAWDGSLEPPTKNAIRDKIESMGTSGGIDDSGWTEVTDTWTYSSVSAVTIPAGGTSIYKKWMKVRFTQGGVVKYFFCSALTSTLMSFAVNTSYTVANSAITAIAYSFVDNPYGFPNNFNFTPSGNNFSLGNSTVNATYTISRGVCKGNIFVKYPAASPTGTISGQIQVNCPVTPSTKLPTYTTVGAASMVDSGTALYMCETILNTTLMELRAINTAGTYAVWAAVSNTVPFTLGVNDSWSIEFAFLLDD